MEAAVVAGERGGGSRGDGSGGSFGGDVSGGGGSATDFSTRRVGQDDKKTKGKLDEARGKVTLKSRVRRHIRICVTRTGAEPEPAT